jgi:hypothetical protein
MENSNSTEHDDCQYGSITQWASWFLNFKNHQVFLAHPILASQEGLCSMKLVRFLSNEVMGILAMLAQ